MRALVVLALIAPAVGAEDLDALSARLKKTASAEYASYATEDFTEQALAALAKSPRHARVVCEAAAIGILRILDSASARSGWTKITKWCERLSGRCRKAAPRDPCAIAAQAEASVLAARLARARKEDEAAHWSRAADFYLETHFAQPARDVLLGALACLKEMRRVDLRLSRVYELGRRLYPTTVYFHVPPLQRRLKSLRLAHAPDKSSVQEIVGSLAPLRRLRGKGWFHDEAVLLHNDSVRLARKLGLKAPYVTRTFSVGRMFVEAPVGKHWQKKGKFLVRFDDGGRPVRSLGVSWQVVSEDPAAAAREWVEGLRSGTSGLPHYAKWIGETRSLEPEVRMFLGAKTHYSEVSGTLAAASHTPATGLALEKPMFVRFRCWTHPLPPVGSQLIVVAETDTKPDLEFEEVLASLRTNK